MNVISGYFGVLSYRAWLLTAPDHTGPHRVTYLLTYLHLAYSPPRPCSPPQPSSISW